MLVLLLEKQRRRMNMHDVIQVWHTVHAAMHCVSSSTAAYNALCFSASQARKGRPGPDVWNSNVYLPLPPDMCMCAYCIFQGQGRILALLDRSPKQGSRCAVCPAGHRGQQEQGNVTIWFDPDPEFECGGSQEQGKGQPDPLPSQTDYIPSQKKGKKDTD